VKCNNLKIHVVNTSLSLVICTSNYLFDVLILSVNKGLLLEGKSMVEYANEGFVFGVKIIHKLRFSN
jgi:hypothetical protein